MPPQIPSGQPSNSGAIPAGVVADPGDTTAGGVLRRRGAGGVLRRRGAGGVLRRRGAGGVLRGGLGREQDLGQAAGAWDRL
ncbi:hypothetical protein ACXC9Q_28605 [Kribbella sp. CWNU-51]